MIIAEVLFDTALEPLTEWADLQFGVAAVRVARDLHHVIWSRFPAGAVAYADALRARIFKVEQHARQRLSRDLHDRISHGVATAAQRIQLAAEEADQDTPRCVTTSVSWPIRRSGCLALGGFPRPRALAR